MKLPTLYDERTITETQAETLTIPSGSPYSLSLLEVPDSTSGVKIRRISEASKNGSGSGTMATGGIYLGSTNKSMVVKIDTAGEIGVGGATFKWSDDGGVTWDGTLVPIEDTDPIVLALGIEVSFTSGAGQDFYLNDEFTFTAEFWTEVSYVPVTSKQYQVNYVNGSILFHSADAGLVVESQYEGRGSLAKAADINAINDILNAGELAKRGDDTSSLTASKAAYIKADGTWGLADASDETKVCSGFIKTVDAAVGEIVFAGPLGGFVSLTPGAQYYLSVSEGEITSTPPSTGGEIVQKVGRALTSTTLLVAISPYYEVVS